MPLSGHCIQSNMANEQEFAIGWAGDTIEDDVSCDRGTGPMRLGKCSQRISRRNSRNKPP